MLRTCVVIASKSGAFCPRRSLLDVYVNRLWMMRSVFTCSVPEPSCRVKMCFLKSSEVVYQLVKVLWNWIFSLSRGRVHSYLNLHIPWVGKSLTRGSKLGLSPLEAPQNKISQTTGGLVEAFFMALWDLRLTDPTISIKISADTLISMIRSLLKATMQRCDQKNKH